MFRVLAILALTIPMATLAAKDDLGVFDQWAAFRDPQGARCYAIAMADSGDSAFPGYADVATWPRRGVRGQVHFRLSRDLAKEPRLTLALGGERFALTGGGADAWAVDKQMDAAIVAAMRSASSMTLSATDARGRRFNDRYDLAGVATALDAAAVACAQIR